MVFAARRAIPARAKANRLFCAEYQRKGGRWRAPYLCAGTHPALRKQGWLWTEEYIWHKRNCYPGKWPNRFRDAWERCLHFTKEKKFKMNQDAVMIPMGDWAGSRLKSLGKNDVVRFDSKVGSGFGKNIANWVRRSMAYPTNVLHLAT